MIIVAGTIVLVPAGGKIRPGVVLRVTDDGRAYVVWGTGTLHAHSRHVVVEPREPSGIALGLKKRTYFYARNPYLGPVERLNAKGPCPLDLVASLRALVGFART